MKAVIQRASKASVIIEKKTCAKIKAGLLVLVGIDPLDTVTDINWLSNKICNLRVFNDENGIMNLSLKETGGDIIVVSQFTLHASTKKGNRPSYIKAAKLEIAIPIYQKFVTHLEGILGKKIQTGEFGAYMQLDFINDGPVTLIIDTKNRE